MGTLFIDTYYREEEEKQKEQFDKYTQMLWDFAEKVEPFACKDVEVALTELGEETEKNRNLSKNLTDTIALKNEKIELEKNLTRSNEILLGEKNKLNTKIDTLEGTLQSTNENLTDTINENIKLENRTAKLDDEKSKLNIKIDELESLNKSLIETRDENKKLKDKLRELNVTTENPTQKPIITDAKEVTNVTDATNLTEGNLAKVNESETETLINQANLGSTGSSPGILAIVACVAFIFGCATVLVVQKVRKRKGNAGKSLKSLPYFQ